MWTCPKCMFDNNDRNASCEQCGTPRNNRRFSTPVVQSAVYTAPQPQERQPAFNRDMPPASGRANRNPRYSEPLPPPRSTACRLLRLCGALLSLLLPLLCILLCWKQYDVLYGALVPLLMGSAEQTVAGTFCYLLFCVCAVLLCAAPGLSMLMVTGKYKKKKHKEDSKLL